jgi:hypothetical protein
MSVKAVQAVLVFESGRKHVVTVQLDEGEGVAHAFDLAALAAKVYLEDQPTGPEPFAELTA